MKLQHLKVAAALLLALAASQASANANKERERIVARLDDYSLMLGRATGCGIDVERQVMGHGRDFIRINRDGVQRKDFVQGRQFGYEHLAFVLLVGQVAFELLVELINFPLQKGALAHQP